MLMHTTVAAGQTRGEGQKSIREAAFSGMCRCYKSMQQVCGAGRKSSVPDLCRPGFCYLAKAHRQVEGANVFGQRANGDEIDAGFGEFA